jgi:hypothetical protein
MGEAKVMAKKELQEYLDKHAKELEEVIGGLVNHLVALDEKYGWENVQEAIEELAMTSNIIVFRPVVGTDRFMRILEARTIAEQAPDILGDRDFWYFIFGNADTEKAKELAEKLWSILHGNRRADCMASVLMVATSILYDMAEAERKIREKRDMGVT